MKLDFDRNTNMLSISAYSKDGITVGGRLLAKPFVVTGNEIFLDLLPPSVGSIGPEHIEKLVEFEQHIVLIGTGETQTLFDARILQPALEARVGIEVMNTAAACRIYNVLAAENRAVLGAFYMP
jgi:uncharacterized protein